MLETIFQKIAAALTAAVIGIVGLVAPAQPTQPVELPPEEPISIEISFIQKQIEYLRGVFTVLRLSNHFSGITPENLEKFAVAMLKQLKITCKNYEKGPVVKNVEDFKIKIYAEALKNLFDPNKQLAGDNSIANHIRKLLL